MKTLTDYTVGDFSTYPLTVENGPRWRGQPVLEEAIESYSVIFYLGEDGASWGEEESSGNVSHKCQGYLIRHPDGFDERLPADVGLAIEKLQLKELR